MFDVAAEERKDGRCGERELGYLVCEMLAFEILMKGLAKVVDYILQSSLRAKMPTDPPLSLGELQTKSLGVDSNVLIPTTWKRL